MLEGNQIKIKDSGSVQTWKYTSSVLIAIFKKSKPSKNPHLFLGNTSLDSPVVISRSVFWKSIKNVLHIEMYRTRTRPQPICPVGFGRVVIEDSCTECRGGALPIFRFGERKTVYQDCITFASYKNCREDLKKLGLRMLKKTPELACCKVFESHSTIYI